MLRAFSSSFLLLLALPSLIVLPDALALQVPQSGPQRQHPEQSRRAFLGAAAVAAALAVVPTRPSNAAAAAAVDVAVGGRPVYGDESIMAPKAHGTTAQPVQSDLKYGVSQKLADQICSFNRRFAEMAGSFRSTSFEKDVLSGSGPITFYDSVSGEPLFVAPVNRSPESFVEESIVHGWPSFRDDEVVWQNVRVLRPSGEVVSTAGTHLGRWIDERTVRPNCC